MYGKLIQSWEIDFIKNNYLNLTDIEISEHLKRSYLTVANTRRKLGCLKLGSPKRFTKEQSLFIKLNFMTMSNHNIAIKINRTENSIVNFLSRNRLTRGTKRRVYNSKFINEKVYRMKELINICETTKSPYVKDKSIIELKKLSGL